MSLITERDIQSVQDDQMYFAHVDQVAVASNYSHVSLVNTQVAGKSLLLYRVEFAAQAAANIALTDDDTTVLSGGGHTGRQFNEWRNITPTPGGWLRKQANASRFGSSNEHLIIIGSSGQYEWHLPVPIFMAPNKAVIFVNTTVNQQLAATFFWREAPHG